MSELKPCPFCGGEPEMIHAVLEEYHSVNPEIICRECGYRIKAKYLAISIADSPKETCKFLDRQTIQFWNTRPAEDALKAKVERMKKALNKIDDLTFMPRNKDKVLDRTWHIARAALATDTDVPANAPDTGKMEENQK